MLVNILHLFKKCRYLNLNYLKLFLLNKSTFNSILRGSDNGVTQTLFGFVHHLMHNCSLFQKPDLFLPIADRDYEQYPTQ